MRKLAFTILWLLSSNSFANPFTINSTSVANGDKITAKYTCDGKDMSPNFSWSNAPDNTNSFAMIIHDPDAPKGTVYHWLIYNINKNIHQLAEGLPTPPRGVAQGKNTDGKTQYKGPCPPKGSMHHYIVSLYALDLPPNLPEGYDNDKLQKAINGHTLGIASYQFLYGH